MPTRSMSSASASSAARRAARSRRRPAPASAHQHQGLHQVGAVEGQPQAQPAAQRVADVGRPPAGVADGGRRVVEAHPTSPAEPPWPGRSTRTTSNVSARRRCGPASPHDRPVWVKPWTRIEPGPGSPRRGAAASIEIDRWHERRRRPRPPSPARSSTSGPGPASTVAAVSPRLPVDAARPGPRRRRPHRGPGLPRRAVGLVLRARGGQGVGAAGGRAVHVGHGGGQLPPRGAGGVPRPGAADRRAPPTARPSCATPAPARPSTSSSSTATSVRWFAEVGAPAEVDRPRAYWRSVGGPVGGGGVAARRPDPSTSTSPSGSRWCRPATTSWSPTAAPAGRPWVTSTVRRPRPDPDDVDRLAWLVAADAPGRARGGLGRRRGSPEVGRALRRRRRLAGAGRPHLRRPFAGPTPSPPTTPSCGSPGVADRLRPDVVLRVGAPLTGKVATALARRRRSPRSSSTPTGRGSTPTGRASERMVADADRPPRRRLADRLEAPDAVPVAVAGGVAARPRPPPAEAIDAAASTPDDVPFEGRIARDLVAGLPDGRRPGRRVEHAGPRRRVVRPAPARASGSSPTGASTASTASCPPCSAWPWRRRRRRPRSSPCAAT